MMPSGKGFLHAGRQKEGLRNAARTDNTLSEPTGGTQELQGVPKEKEVVALR